jgi:beta-glucosidase
MIANYFGYPSEITTVLDGIREKVGPEVEVVYEKGVNLVDEFVFEPIDGSDMFSIDGRKGFKAEYFQNMEWEGVSPLVRYEERLDYKWGNSVELGHGIVADFMTAVYRSVFTAPETRTYCFELHADDDANLFIDGKTPEKTGFINNYYLLEAEAGKTYDIEIRFSQEGDTAELLFDIGYLKNTDYSDVASSVADADAIVYVGGLSSKLEGEEMSVRIEGFDRGDKTSIDLPAVQKKMLESLISTGKPVVFVLMTGSAIGLEWENENVPAIINAWYGGQAGGTAVADVLFGDYNPSGKLPVTFYRSVDDLPDFENYDMKGRTYRYFEGKPVYAFGHGLSYTAFSFGKGKVVERKDGTKELVVKVKNTGNLTGEDVLQLYVSRPDDKEGPVKALKGFTRFSLKPGESTTVTIPFDEETFSIWNQETGRMEPVPGTFILHYGNSSDASSLETMKYTL